MTVRARVLSLVCLTILAWSAPTAAFAHVGVKTDNARPGAVGVLTIHVPNESDSADTVKVELQLPDGFEFVDAKANRGWQVTSAGRVVTIEGGTIPPGGERDFRIRVRNAGERGEYAFPAIQSYSDGERVRWTGAKGSDSPAPVLVVAGKPVKAPGERTEASPAPTAEATPTEANQDPTPSAPASPAATSAADDAPASILPVVLLAVLGAAGAAIVLGRSRRRTQAVRSTDTV